MGSPLPSHQQIAAWKGSLAKSLTDAARPLLHKSGYVDTDGPLMLHSLGKKVPYRNGGGIDLVGIGWFSDDGYGGGLCTTRYRDLALEDLLRLHPRLLKQLQADLQKHKAAHT